MTKLRKPRFKSMSTISEVGGIPILRALWDRFNFSLLLSQAGIFKIRGVATWILAFLYMMGLVAGCSSVNELASLYTKDGLLQRMFRKVNITQPTLSRFLTGFTQWSAFNSKRTERLQKDTETALSDGDIIALDDTHAPHPYAEKIPFLYWLFDSSRKVHIWAMNLVVLHAVRKNGVEYPWSCHLEETTGRIRRKPKTIEVGSCLENAVCFAGTGFVPTLDCYGSLVFL